jgi:diaminopimelate epimerase
MSGEDRWRFWKGHALGNDYIVLEAGSPPPAVVRRLCDRHCGVGGDGVLVGDLTRDPVGLRIFNPDGGEAEKSGNGLRIFAAWLHSRGLVDETPFQVALPAETVELAVLGARPDGAVTVRADMGTASFRAGDVHYDGAPAGAEVLDAPLDLGGETVRIHLVSTGNPHCVVFPDADTRPPARPGPPDRRDLARLGPALQAQPGFRHGVNVQLARVTGPDSIEALVWERGAGETMASGSSACAIAAVAVRTGRVTGPRLQVRMPGGLLEVEVGDGWRLRLTGPAQVVFEGWLAGPVVAGWA